MGKKPIIKGFLVLLCLVLLFSLTCCSKGADPAAEENRTILAETGKGDITYNANLPEGYSFRNTNDPEIFEDTQKRIHNEKVGEYEVLKDGNVIVYIYHRPEGSVQSTRESLEMQKEQITPGGPGPKGIEFLDDGTDKNGNKYLFYEYQYRDDTTAYVYIIDFPEGSKCSLELSTIDSREDAEKFFKLLNFKFETK